MRHFSRNLAHITLPLCALLLAIAIFAVNHHAALAASTQASELQQDASSPTADSTLLVQFDAGISNSARDQMIAEMGGELVMWIAAIHVAEIRMPAEASAATSSAIARNLTNGAIAFAESNAMVSATYSPNDPDFRDELMSYGLEQVQALDAWDIITGSQEIVIAVIDSGIQAAHPEFEGRLVAGYDFINDDVDTEDDSGHGTHVAGIIAAALDNDQGIAGVCPHCKLMPVKVLNANNLGSWAQLASGIIFAVDNGARVLNLSLGASIPSETLASAVDYAIQSGVVVVAAAGNYGSDQPFYPAALDDVIAVGATTIKGGRWAKSDFGDYIDFVAPGEVIYSTYHDMDNLYRGYTYMSGTSMAAPFVSGVAGLLLSIAPTLDADAVFEAMKIGTDDLGTAGWDADFGHGRVNAMGALLAPVEGLVEAVGDISEPKQQVMMFLPTLNRP